MRPDFWILLLTALLCSAGTAQTLIVTATPFSPASASAEAGSAFAREVAAFRFSAAGGAFTLNGFTLTNGGSGNWATELSGVNGIEVWRDDGDGAFTSATDLSLFQGAGAQPSVTAALSSAQNIASGNAADFWIVLNFLASAGGSVPTTFITAISSITDVSASGGTVQLGSPAPASGTLSVVIFFVTSFTPLSGGGGQDIVITGSGFTTPVSATINGYAVPGAPVVNAGNTQITGLKTATFGGKKGMTIILSTSLLGPRTLSFTFSQSSGGDTGPPCTTDSNSSVPGLTLMCLAALAAVLLRRSRTLERRGWSCTS